MALEYRTRDRDTVDLIAFKVYGSTAGGVVERILEDNPGVADLGATLPGGLLLTLRDPEPATVSTSKGVRLWD
jgi:phage tail protein X